MVVTRLAESLTAYSTSNWSNYPIFICFEWMEWDRGVYRLPPNKILSFGKRVLVSEAAAQTLAVYREGIKTN